MESDVNVPTPFKRNLFWPPAPTETKRRRAKEKIPAVVTSPQMIEYLQKKDERKKKTEEEKEKRKQLREAKKLSAEEKKKLTVEEKKKVAVEEKKKRKRQPSISSDSSISIEDSDDLEMDEEINDSSDYNEKKMEDMQNVDKENLKEGDFILVKFMGGKRKSTEFIYLCVVQSLDDMIQVIGLKSVENSKKEFIVDEEDLSTITFDQILGILPNPEISMRGERFRYIFKNPLNIKEK